MSRESSDKFNGRHIVDHHPFKLISTWETHDKFKVNGRHMII